MTRTSSGSPASGSGRSNDQSSTAAMVTAFHLAHLERETLRLGVPAETVSAIVDAGVQAIADLIQDRPR